MVMVLERFLVEEMASIGRDRSPSEAAGVLLPFPFRGRQIIELPNRSLTPHDHFEMRGEDLVLALEEFASVHTSPKVWNELVLWHTHPSGNVGPSKYDLQHKMPNLRHLVVSLPEEGEALATWY